MMSSRTHGDFFLLSFVYLRFVREKAEYKGTWTIPKRRAKKDPRAPKRPMSAFLKYSQQMRPVVKEENPYMSNTDVSRLLGEMWRNASPKDKAPYREQEEQERALYKEQIKKFKDDKARADAASRTSHQHMQQQQQKMAEYHQQQKMPAAAFESAKSASSFDTARVESVEEAASKADQRIMYRQSFGVPFTSYRPAYGTYGHVFWVLTQQQQLTNTFCFLQILPLILALIILLKRITCPL